MRPVVDKCLKISDTGLVGESARIPDGEEYFALSVFLFIIKGGISLIKKYLLFLLTIP